MRAADVVRLAWKNVAQSRRGAALAALSVAIGVAAVTALTAAGNTAREKITALMAALEEGNA